MNTEFETALDSALLNASLFKMIKNDLDKSMRRLDQVGEEIDVNNFKVTPDVNLKMNRLKDLFDELGII